MLIDRRDWLAGLAGTALLLLTGCATGTPPPEQGNGSADERLRQALAALEASSGGKLGIAVLDAKDGTLVGHRADERFTMCSTFKLSLVAAVLARADAGDIALDALIPITPDDPVGHSPAVRAALAKGETAMSLAALCEASQTVSDNGASNILLRRIGGPQALTAFWRGLGDNVTRLDRYEPELNIGGENELRDTTSPAAMTRSMRAILTGPVLKPASRQRLIDWTVATQTGLKRLRGGLPAGWRAGDKTGTNMGDGSYAGKVNDIAIVWHPGRAEPFLISAFLEPSVRGGDTRPEDEAVLAQVGRIAAGWVAERVAHR